MQTTLSHITCDHQPINPICPVVTGPSPQAARDRARARGWQLDRYDGALRHLCPAHATPAAPAIEQEAPCPAPSA